MAARSGHNNPNTHHLSSKNGAVGKQKILLALLGVSLNFTHTYETDIYPYRTNGARNGRVADRMQSVLG